MTAVSIEPLDHLDARVVATSREAWLMAMAGRLVTDIMEPAWLESFVKFIGENR